MIDFTDAIHEAIEKFTCRPTKIISDFKLVGINMSQEMINLIEKQGVVYNQSENNSPCYFGIPVYKKEGINRVQYIIEGKIEGFNKYLTWEDLKFEKRSESCPTGVTHISAKMGETKMEIFGQYAHDKIHHYVEIYRNINGKNYFFTSFLDFEDNEEDRTSPQAFNDLHLEVIE